MRLLSLLRRNHNGLYASRHVGGNIPLVHICDTDQWYVFAPCHQMRRMTLQEMNTQNRTTIFFLFVQVWHSKLAMVFACTYVVCVM
jgi:hypothetical protein